MTPDSVSPPAGLGDRARWINALVVISSAFCVGVSIFVTLPLIGLSLERNGVSGFVIGLVLGSFSASVLLSGPLLPALVARFGTLPVMLAGVVLSAATTLLFPLIPGVLAWALIRFVGGFGLAAHWIVGETWLNTLTADHDRGRMIGAYSMMFAAGVAVGPLVVNLVGIDGLLPWALAAGLIMLSAVPLLAIRHSAPALPPSDAAGFLRAARIVPMFMITGGLAGLCESAIFAMLPVYGVRIGFDEHVAGLLLSAFVFGNIFLQVPLGMVLDWADRRGVLIGCAALSALIGMLVPAVEAGWALYPLLFLWGGALFGFYTIGLMGIGERLPVGMLAAGNAGFIMTYEIGSMIGPPVTGAAMDGFGTGMIGITGWAIALPATLWMVWRWLPRR